jgi:hypothetical protein
MKEMGMEEMGMEEMGMEETGMEETGPRRLGHSAQYAGSSRASHQFGILDSVNDYIPTNSSDHG